MWRKWSVRIPEWDNLQPSNLPGLSTVGTTHGWQETIWGVATTVGKPSMQPRKREVKVRYNLHCFFTWIISSMESKIAKICKKWLNFLKSVLVMIGSLFYHQDAQCTTFYWSSDGSRKMRWFQHVRGISGFSHLPTSIRASKVRPWESESLCQGDQAEM